MGVPTYRVTRLMIRMMQLVGLLILIGGFIYAAPYLQNGVPVFLEAASDSVPQGFLLLLSGQLALAFLDLVGHAAEQASMSRDPRDR